MKKAREAKVWNLKKKKRNKKKKKKNLWKKEKAAREKGKEGGIKLFIKREFEKKERLFCGNDSMDLRLPWADLPIFV